MLIPKRNPIRQFFFLIGLYFQYFKIHSKKRAEYPLDTWISVVSGMLIFLSSLIFLEATLRKTPHIFGWSFYPLLMLFAITATGRGLMLAFINAPNDLPGSIRRSYLDILMIRPVGVLAQQIGLSQQFFGFGGALSGIIIIIYAACHLPIDWSLPKIAFLVMAVICCTLIQFAIILMVGIPTFWVLEMQSIVLPVAWLVDFARYPLPIYHPLLRGLLTYALPYAFGSYFPVSYLLHPVQYQWALYAVPGVTILLMAVAYRFWLFGLRHYKSGA